MSKTYVIAVDSMRAINADSEEEALRDARHDFIEMLQRDVADLLVIEEFEDEDCLAAEMDSSDIEMLQEQLRKFSPPQEYDDE